MTVSAPRILMVAGEASADLHGSLVVRALKTARPDIQVFGIGGEHMVAEGFMPLARSEDISVMGLTEVLRKLLSIYAIGRRVLAEARRDPPVAAILIDLPDFNLRLAKRLKRLRVPVIYYISPQVWAWRERRVKQIKRLVDRMLVILPFEEDFYRRHGVAATFVGHPLVEEMALAGHDLPDARAQLGLPVSPAPVVALLPGSRGPELRRHLPVLVLAAARVATALPGVRFILPVASPALRPQVEAALREYAHSGQPSGAADIQLLDGRADLAVRAADVAAVCSGTATLQTALWGTPLVVFYKVSWLSYQILRRLVTVAHVALVNLIAGKPLVTELLQHDCTPEKLASQLEGLLRQETLRQTMRAELGALRDTLGSHTASQEVARVALEYLVS